MSFKRIDAIHSVLNLLESQNYMHKKDYADVAQMSVTTLSDLFREVLDYLEDPISNDEGVICYRQHCDEHSHGNGELECAIEKLERELANCSETLEQLRESL